MDAEAQKSSAPRQSKKCLFITILSICVIVVVGIGVYFTFSNENSTQIDDQTDKISEYIPESSKWVDNEEIKILRKYLQFPTVSLEAYFAPCVGFLEELASQLDLEFSTYYPVNDQNPVIVMTWLGSQPELPSIMLNSHMDVVPVAEEYWNHPPFEARMDNFGNIHARGAQDMKSIGVQYLAAIRALKQKGTDRLKRTIHLTYVPDEETGGEFGMGAFVKTEEFKNLNVGCALDEGYPSATADLEVYYDEKSEWEVNITAQGHSGHSSILFQDTAMDKLNYVINKFLEFRRNESSKLNDLHLPYGNVTAINLTILKGGIKSNVVPPEMSAFIDMRLARNIDLDELEDTIYRWVKEAGDNVTATIFKYINADPTPIDSSNLYWMAFKTATEQLKLNVTPAVFRAVTDSRYLRDMNIPALGFSPFMNTEPKLHEHNEYINADTYLKGITIYEKIIETMGNFD